MKEIPPGPKGEPLFGSSRTYADDPFRFISALESAYGDVARFDMGPMETVLLCDPTAIERVLVSEANRFRKPDFQGDALGDLLGDGLLLSEGETWEKQRKLANPAFSMSRLSGMAGRITGHAEDRLDGITAGDIIDAERPSRRSTGFSTRSSKSARRTSGPTRTARWTSSRCSFGLVTTASSRQSSYATR